MTVKSKFETVIILKRNKVIKASCIRNGLFPYVQHHFLVKLDRNRRNAFAISFIPITSKEWNTFSVSVFPSMNHLRPASIKYPRIYSSYFFDTRVNPVL